ncbi:MAG: hypothetical protein CMN30_03645 [Sandaracinus sp.]|nr:hypothetical protein [Sandaracinus sp.]
MSRGGQRRQNERQWPARVDILDAHQHLAIHRSADGVDRPEPRSVHGQAALTLVLGGTGTLWCGSPLDLRPLDVVYVPSGSPHYVADSSPRRTLTLAVCPSCMTSTAGARLLGALESIFGGHAGKLSLDEETADRLRRVLEILDEELRSPRARVALATEGGLSLVTALLERAARARALGSARAASSRPPTLTERALEYVSTHATRGVSLVEVAAHVGRSSAHVAATVKAETGRTVVEWITDVRIATACRLLLETDESVESVAQHVGFASPSHFHRVFRRQRAMTPGRWRSVHRSAGVADDTKRGTES